MTIGGAVVGCMTDSSGWLARLPTWKLPATFERPICGGPSVSGVIDRYLGDRRVGEFVLPFAVFLPLVVRLMGLIHSMLTRFHVCGIHDSLAPEKFPFFWMGDSCRHSRNRFQYSWSNHGFQRVY